MEVILILRPEIQALRQPEGWGETCCQTAVWTRSPGCLGPISLLRADSEIRLDDFSLQSLTLVKWQR